MTEYEAAHLCPGQGLFFVDGTYGEVQSILDGWIRIAWEDLSITDLHISDFEGIDKYEGPPRPRTAVEEETNSTRTASSFRGPSKSVSHHYRSAS
jgi:hypothetical protein